MNRKRKEELGSLAKRVGRRMWRIATHNPGLKLLSVFFALVLWSYVVTSSPSITREKVLSAIDVTVTGQSVLSSRGLSVLTDVTALPEATLRVRVAQSSFTQVTSDNVRVELDLSGIRSPGKQSVRLRATTTYGSVVEIRPQYIDLDIENQDQRYVPVNVAVSGQTDPTYWYSVSRANPSQITVTGPTSIVQTVSSALVKLDVTGRYESHNRVEPFTLLDAQGAEVAASLSRSTNSITVSVDIYPMKELPIAAGADDLITGKVPDGYELTNVSVSPSSVFVAADKSLLSGLATLSVVPVDVTGHARTFTAIAQINALRGVKNLSTDQVSVTATIEEQELTKRFSNIQLQMTNIPGGKSVTLLPARTEVKASGPYSAVRALSRGDFQAVVNLSGLDAGEYELPIDLSVDNYPDMHLTANPATVKVVVTDQNR